MTNIRQGLLHRAFSVFLFRPSDGSLLLQKRADEKITFPSMWTNTCCSHPLSIKGELEEQGEMGVRRAAMRKLPHELGVPEGALGPEDFTYLTKIHYLAPCDDGVWGEHESEFTAYLYLLSPNHLIIIPTPNHSRPYLIHHQRRHARPQPKRSQ
jgi:isopentenyl-diphosphate delta-isomerase